MAKINVQIHTIIIDEEKGIENAVLFTKTVRAVSDCKCSGCMREAVRLATEDAKKECESIITQLYLEFQQGEAA